MSVQPEGPRHTPAEHLVAAEDLLDAVGANPAVSLNAHAEEITAWAAQAQSCALLAAVHIGMAAILSEE